MGSEDRDGFNGAKERRGEDFGGSSSGGDGNGNGEGKCEGFTTPFASPSMSQESKKASGDIGSAGKNTSTGRGFTVHERIKNALDHYAFGTAKASMTANDDGSRGGGEEEGRRRRREAACTSARDEGRYRVTATASSAAAAASSASGDINRPTVPSSACCASSVSAEGGMPDRSKVGDGQGDGGGDSNKGESEHVPGVGSWREGERGTWGGTTGKMEEKETDREVILPGDGGVIDESFAVGSGGDGKFDGLGVDKEGGVERSGLADDDNDAAATAAAAAEAAARTRDEIAFLRELQTVSNEESDGGGAMESWAVVE